MYKKAHKFQQELELHSIIYPQSEFSIYVTHSYLTQEPLQSLEQQVQKLSLHLPPRNIPETFKIIEDLNWVLEPRTALNAAQQIQKILEDLPQQEFFASSFPIPNSNTFTGFRILESLPPIYSALTSLKTTHLTQNTSENTFDNFMLHSFFKKNYNLELESKDNQELYAFISRWHKVPYRWGGNTIKGIDCSGLIGIIADSLFQVKVPRDAGNIFKKCLPLPKDSLKEGDLVFFTQGSYIFHVGMYLKNNKFVHASSGLGVIISDLNEPYYKKFFFCGGRIRKE